MCGIFCLLEPSTTEQSFFNKYNDVVDDVAAQLHHRGPDMVGSTVVLDPKARGSAIMVHTRLAINGNLSPQPLMTDDEQIMLVINGEIFNWKELEQELGYKCQRSDCEIILPLYEKYKGDIKTLFHKLEGQFSFVLYDLRESKVLVGRDHIGVTPMYMGCSDTGRTVIASELKCVLPYADDFSVFPPRSYFYGTMDSLPHHKEFPVYVSYHDVPASSENSKGSILEHLREHLTRSVDGQLSDLLENGTEFGVLLSGGLDSSLIASLVVSLAKSKGYEEPIKTFSIGVSPDVPDLVAARKVANHLQTDHHEYCFTVRDGIHSIPKVIEHVESYDCTTVRASTPMYILASYIKLQYPKIKVLFSGELSDELFCYLYGANAPSEQAFQRETEKLVNNVHLFDCLRANKTCMAHSMEVRVPFADSKFVKYVLSLHPRLKMFGEGRQMEKQLLRDAFIGFLPNEILYRKKEQFSDGVSGLDGNNWIDGIKSYCNSLYTQDEYDFNQMMYSHNKPDTREKMYYREIFCSLFDKKAAERVVEQWVPKWCQSSDPSGRNQSFWAAN